MIIYIINIIYIILILYEYILLYNIKKTYYCNRCFNKNTLNNLYSLFKLLFILLGFKFLIYIFLDNLEIEFYTIKIFIFLLHLSIILTNLLILYYIHILILEKEIIEKEHNIICECLVSTISIKIINNIYNINS